VEQQQALLGTLKVGDPECFLPLSEQHGTQIHFESAARGAVRQAQALRSPQVPSAAGRGPGLRSRAIRATSLQPSV
jgi:hypothetical protein